MEASMKRLAVPLATAIALFFAGETLAQSVQVEVNPEQRTRIREYVVKERVPRATVRERVRVGAPVPREVELREVPADWGPSLKSYRYYYSDHGVHFVDPANRHVVYEFD